MNTSTDGYTPFLTPAEIYHQLRDGKGSGSLNNAQFSTQMELPEETDRAELLASLADLIATGWQGQASAAAHGAALPLRDHVLANADKLERVQDLLSRQAGSFERAYNSVLPVPDVPQQSLDEPVPFDVDHAKEVAFYQGIAQHNMDVFGQYDGASEYNETNMPQEFHAGGRGGGDVSVKSADSIEVGEPHPGGKPGDGVLGGPGEDSGPGGSSSGYPRSSAGEPAGSGGPQEGSGGVTGSSGVLPSGGGVTQANDYRPGVVGGSPSSGYSSSLPGVGGSVSAGPGGVVGGVPVGGYSGGGGGGVPRMGGDGRGGGGAGGTGVVRGPGGAVGVGPLSAEENAVRRGAAGAGSARGGVGAVGAPLGNKGNGDEDAEHERKVLIEVDSEEIFGSAVLTAPPVIGDDEYED